jgi:hypothetical protein
MPIFDRATNLLSLRPVGFARNIRVGVDRSLLFEGKRSVVGQGWDLSSCAGQASLTCDFLVMDALLSTGAEPQGSQSVAREDSPSKPAAIITKHRGMVNKPTVPCLCPLYRQGAQRHGCKLCPSNVWARSGHSEDSRRFSIGFKKREHVSLTLL